MESTPVDSIPSRSAFGSFSEPGLVAFFPPRTHNALLDNITHTLTGLFLSRAGLNRLTPAATPILLIAANLPDVDIISLLGGPTSYLHWHRHLTHSVLLAPVLAIAVAAIFRLFRPSVALFPAFAAAFCGVASHLLLDLTNIYGVRLLLPFRSTWFDWDLTPVIDYWIWAALALAVAGPFLARLVGSEVGEQRRSPREGRGFAIAALLFLMLYNSGRAVLHTRVVRMLESREYSGAPPLRVAAFPASMNPLRWRGLAETGTAYELFDLSLPAAFNPSVADTIGKAVPSPAIVAAAKTEPFQVLTEFAQYPVYRVIPRTEPEGGFEVSLTDLRFGFTSTATLNRQGQVEKSQFQFGPVVPR